MLYLLNPDPPVLDKLFTSSTQIAKLILAQFVKNATSTRLRGQSDLPRQLSNQRNTNHNVTPENVDHLGQIFPHLKDGAIAEILIHCDNLYRVSLAHKERHNL